MTKLHRRSFSARELEVLRLVKESSSHVTMMPIFFNGEERFGLGVFVTTTSGTYFRLLTVLAEPSDQILSAEGVEASPRPVPFAHQKN